MLGMRRQDLEELYELLELYERTYGTEASGRLLAEISERYQNRYRENIGEKRNPRQAGRKRKYTETDRATIRESRKRGMTIRKIAQETGCSVGYVQGVLSEP